MISSTPYALTLIEAPPGAVASISICNSSVDTAAKAAVIVAPPTPPDTIEVAVNPVKSGA